MVSKLHDILKPFLLRRVKSDVATNLPPKREIVLYAPLTSNQLEIEKKLVNKTLISEIQEQLASKSGRSTHTSPTEPFLPLLFRFILCQMCLLPFRITQSIDSFSTYQAVHAQKLLVVCGTQVWC